MKHNPYYRLLVILLLCLPSLANADQLVQNSMPAERMRGCVWADQFRSEAAVEKNGGTEIGAPTFDVNKGVILNGTTQYVTYALRGDEFNSANISIVADFTADFASNDGVQHNIMDTTNTKRTIIRKDSSDRLNVFLGATTAIFVISYIDYIAYWNELSRNVIVVSATSGENYIYVNGHQVATSATAWTPQAGVTTMTVGAEDTGAHGARFPGTIHSLKVFHSLLTQQEAQDYYDQTTFSYMDHAVVFPMLIGNDTGTAITDASGTYSLDKHGAPVKLSHRGYNLDGANDYFAGTIDTSIFNHDPISIVMVFAPGVNADDVSGKRAFFNANNGVVHNTYFYHNSVSNVYLLTINGVSPASISEADMLKYWRPHQPNVLVISCTSGDNSVFLNGNIVMDSETDAWTTYDDIDTLRIGSYVFDPSEAYLGDVNYFGILPVKITQLQACDFTVRMRTEPSTVLWSSPPPPPYDANPLAHYWHFNGTTDALRLSGVDATATDLDPASNTNDFTMIAEIDPDTLVGSPGIFGRWNGPAAERSYLMLRNPGGNDIVFQTYSSGIGSSTITELNCLTVGIPNFVAQRYVYNAPPGSTSDMWTDVNAHPTTHTGLAGGPIYGTTSADVQIADYDNALDRFYDGKIYWIGYWNRKLTDAEIADLKSGAVMPYNSPGIVMYIDFHKPVGATYLTELPGTDRYTFTVEGTPTLGP